MKKYGIDIQAYIADLNKAEANARITVEQQRMVAQIYLEVSSLVLLNLN